MTEEIEIRPARIDQIVALRHRILRAGLPPEAARFDGDDEPTSAHFAALRAGVVVGCVSVHRRPLDDEPSWQLRGMAVDESLRRAGVGSRLLDAVETHIQRSAPPHLLWCRGRKPAVPFYLRHGFEIISDEYEVPTAGPHFTMRKLVGTDHQKYHSSQPST